MIELDELLPHFEFAFVNTMETMERFLDEIAAKCKGDDRYFPLGCNGFRQRISSV